MAALQEKTVNLFISSDSDGQDEGVGGVEGFILLLVHRYSTGVDSQCVVSKRELKKIKPSQMEV